MNVRTNSGRGSSSPCHLNCASAVLGWMSARSSGESCTCHLPAADGRTKGRKNLAGVVGHPARGREDRVGTGVPGRELRPSEKSTTATSSGPGSARRVCSLAFPRKNRAGRRKIWDEEYKERWHVKRTFAWVGNFRRLLVRYKRLSSVHPAFFTIACLFLSLREDGQGVIARCA